MLIRIQGLIDVLLILVVLIRVLDVLVVEMLVLIVDVPLAAEMHVVFELVAIDGLVLVGVLVVFDMLLVVEELLAVAFLGERDVLIPPAVLSDGVLIDFVVLVEGVLIDGPLVDFVVLVEGMLIEGVLIKVRVLVEVRVLADRVLIRSGVLTTRNLFRSTAARIALGARITPNVLIPIDVLDAPAVFAALAGLHALDGRGGCAPPRARGVLRRAGVLGALGARIIAAPRPAGAPAGASTRGLLLRS